MANEKIKPEGFFVLKKLPKSPEFILGTLVIDLNKFNDWIENHEGYKTEYNGKSQLKLQILKSREGDIYFQVDNYQKQPNDTF